MKSVIRFFVENHLFGVLIGVFVLLLGTLSLFFIQRERFPNVSYDIITVTTTFPGAAPNEVEQLITNPLETEMKELEGIKRLESHSVENQSVVIIYLDPDETTEDEAVMDLREIVDRFKPDLPDGAEEPRISVLDSHQEPLVEVHVYGDLPDLELRNIAKDVKERLERIPGVSRIIDDSLRDIEIRVETKQEKLSQYQLSLEDLITALKNQNVSIPGGTIETPEEGKAHSEFTVRTTGQFDDLEDVRNTVIRANDIGSAIRVRDVAEVSYALEKLTLSTRTNGFPSVALKLLKREKDDAIDLVDEVQEKLAEIRTHLNPKVKVEFINDSSFYIRRRLGILTNNLFVGLGLVFLLLSLFLPWKIATLVSIGIPFSFLGTMILFNLWDYSLNLISLIGLIIVSGMLVDDAIVVTDNCTRHIDEHGKDSYRAAEEGAGEIWLPVTASVMTTIIVFLPLMYMSGIFGKFVRQIPLGVIIALLISLMEAFLVLPGHVAYFMRKKRAPQDHTPTKREGFWNSVVLPPYQAVIVWVVKHRYLTVGLSMIFVGASLFMGFHMRKVLFPSDDIDIFVVRAQGPVGAGLDQTTELTRPIEKAIRKLPKTELLNFMTEVGRQSMGNQTLRRGTEYSQIIVFLTEAHRRERSADEIIKQIRTEVGEIPGLVRLSFERLNPGPPVGKAVDLGIRGKNYEDILVVVKKAKELLKTYPGVSDIDDSYVLGKKEYRIKLDPQEGAAAGISVVELGNTVRAAYEGIIATTVRKLEEEMDVRVSLSRKERTEDETLARLHIPNRTGRLIPLPRVAQTEITQNLAEYQHEDNRRQIKVFGEVDIKQSSSSEVKAKLAKDLPAILKDHPDVYTEFGGESRDTEESMISLGQAFLGAAMGVLLILVLTFKNLSQPFIIFTVTIPIGISGALWAFQLHGMPVTFLGLMGIIALAGVIVNNAIVYVDYVNRLRQEGVAKADSLFRAAKDRLRPVFLTTLTTAAGLMPTNYGIGGKDPFVTYITVALSWGLLIGSGIILLVMPAALAVKDDQPLLRVWRRLFGRKKLVEMALP